MSRVRVVCFPWAGASAAVFLRWQHAVAPVADLAIVELPGRGTRVGERPFTSLDEAVSFSVSSGRLDTGGSDYILFGHSMGATIAFECAREMRRQGRRQPVALIVSGATAPQLPQTAPRRSDLPDAELIGSLGELAGTPREVTESAELMALLLPGLRADLHAVETYAYREALPLAMSIHAFGGTDDAEATPGDVAAWQQQTTGPFALQIMPGGHFFLKTSESAFLALFTSAIRSATAHVALHH